jgi:N-acetylglucosamine malate deacetylase 1
MSVWDYKKILILSPHTDDGELGAGGTIARFLDEGKEVYYVAFSTCENSLPESYPKDTLKKECLNSLATLGIPRENIYILGYKVRTYPEHRQAILDDLIMTRNQIKPNLVIVPSSSDTHQDHAVIYWESLRAFKKCSSIWGYELSWNDRSFSTDIFVRLQPQHLEMKLKSLNNYVSQQNHSYMQERNISSLMISRGAQIDLPFAEAFELIRVIY